MTLLLDHDWSRGVFRCLKQVSYLKHATFLPDVSDKEAQYIASLFPAFVDSLIKILHENLGLAKENIIPTFFVDTVCDALHHR